MMKPLKRGKLRILMLNHHRRFKSIFRAQVIAEHLVKRGHSVTLVVISDNNRFVTRKEICRGVEVIETPDLLWGRLRSGWDPYNTIVRTRLLSCLKEDFDLLHIFETRPATIIPALNYLKKKRVPLFIDWIDWWGGKGGLIEVNRPRWYRHTFGRVEEYFEENFRKFADGTTVISTALAERAKRLGVSEDSIMLLRGGVDTDHFRPVPVEKARKMTGIDPGAKVLGFSSLDSHLDLKLLLKAVSIVKGRVPDVKVLMTGAASSAVKKTVSSCGLSESVIFTGFLPFKELPLYLSACDIFLLPFPDMLYNAGRWPNKVTDYLSIGRPVVTNPTGELKDIFVDKRFGLTCEYDAEDFADKITALINDPDTAQRMGAQARKWAVENLQWEKRVLELEGFYSKVLTRKGLVTEPLEKKGALANTA